MPQTDAAPPLSSSLPVFECQVSLKDANGQDASFDIASIAAPLVSFTIASTQNGLTTPAALNPADALGSGLLAAIKSFCEGFDWDTYGAALWTESGVPRPVTFESLVVTQWDAVTTDVSPA